MSLCDTTKGRSLSAPRIGCRRIEAYLKCLAERALLERELFFLLFTYILLEPNNLLAASSQYQKSSNS